MDCEHKWEKITPETAWCSACGGLRTGTWKADEYQDPETGNPIRMTSTGYFPPRGGWEEGPVPQEYCVEVYDEPYKYRFPP